MNDRAHDIARVASLFHADERKGPDMARPEPPDIIKNHPLGETIAGHLEVERLHREWYAKDRHPMKLAIAIQYWEGDKAKAMRLARLIADIEQEFRNDVLLMLAGRFDVPRYDDDVFSTMMYCGRKMPTSCIYSKREAVGHPDGCFGLWAGAAEACYEWHKSGKPVDEVLFLESDVVPARWDWINFWKKQHQLNLDTGKLVTGPLMAESTFYPAHVNGALGMHIAAWPDMPSLHHCPSGQAWDCYHGSTLLRVAGKWQGAINLYGAHNLSLSTFKTLGRDYALIASVKDDSSYECAKTLPYAEWLKLYRTAWPEKKEEATT